MGDKKDSQGSLTTDFKASDVPEKPEPGMRDFVMKDQMSRTLYVLESWLKHEEKVSDRGSLGNTFHRLMPEIVRQQMGREWVNLKFTEYDEKERKKMAAYVRYMNENDCWPEDEINPPDF